MLQGAFLLKAVTARAEPNPNPSYLFLLVGFFCFVFYETQYPGSVDTPEW